MAPQRIGAAIVVEESAAPREKFPVGALLPAPFEGLKCAESRRALQLFQVSRPCFFGSEMKTTCYRC